MDGEPNGERLESGATKTMAGPIAKLRRSSRNRESYDEIVELEAKLRRAYIAKELRAQFAERETERYIENVRKQHAAKVTRLEQQAALARDHRRRSEELKNAEDYRRQLTEQITRKEEERCIMAEEARREREVLTEVDRIREQREKFKAKKAKEELMEIMKRERLIFQEMKDIHREEEMEAEAKKLLECEKYWEEIDRRRQEAKRLRETRTQDRERIIAELASALTNAEILKREKERLIAELITEDVKCELLLKEKEEIVKREKMREELAANLEEQIVFTEQCKLRYLEQDRAFAEEIMKKIMEDERTARLTAEAKRRMQLQYREDLVRLIEKRRQIRDEEIINMKMEAEERRRREMIYMEHVKEERRLLLERHASNVGDFLNKSVFTEEEQEIIAKSLQESM
ncbi:meiosis-specific nuclear structural protein 1-like [Hylaeus anthracinus]|uniref:meiosis-specific nuclear structural protein 1-like n=1 Tax=Hylaeus anthracinus TaxID=313031 RepID=UPI0023B8DCE8|nr:meiosis-specific nuclear structural protein 1-like [Hylaeus anthracinus]